MGAPAAVWLVTGGVVAGELGTAVVAPSTSATALIAVAALVGVLCGRWALRGPALAALGVAVGLARMRPVVAPDLPPQHVARLPLPFRTVLTARIDEAPLARPDGTRLVVEAEAVERDGRPASACGRVRLSIREAAPGWAYGDRVRVATILRAPRNFANPGSYDLVGHLAREGIRVTGGVRDAAALERLPGAGAGWRAVLERWRARVAARIADVVAAPEGPVLTALVVGDDGGIAPDLRDAFARAGVVHVLSVSGLHVGLVAAGAVAITRLLLARSEWLLLVTDVERLATVTALVPVLVYTALAGLQVATLRSAVMVSAAVLASLLGRRADVLRTLALAALVLALAVPGSPFEIGWQLSFVSVATIVLGTRRFAPVAAPAGAGRMTRWRVRLAAAGLVSPCALLGTAPLTAFHFHQLSVAGVVANPAVVPLFGALVTGVGLVGAFVEPVTPWLADRLFALAGAALRPGIVLVRALGSPAWAAVDVPIPSVVELALLYGWLAALVLAPGPRRRRLLAATTALVLADVAWWVHERAAPTPRVTFLDVGQGDAAVAERPDGTVIVVDAGGFPGIDFDTGAAVVGPFLWSRKILRVDVLAMTHAHPDHSGGLAYLLAHFRPREFWWTGVPGHGGEWDRLQAALGASGTRVRVLAAGGDVPDDVMVLHPPPGWTDPSLNDSSLTLLLGPEPRVLLTGDLEARGEAAVLATSAALARAAVLKVPHHGSRTSSTRRFVDAVAPDVAVISVGADNRYGLPNREIEAAYRARGTCVLRTDRCGAVTAVLAAGAARVRAMRPGCECAEPAPR